MVEVASARGSRVDVGLVATLCSAVAAAAARRGRDVGRGLVSLAAVLRRPARRRFRAWAAARRTASPRSPGAPATPTPSWESLVLRAGGDASPTESPPSDGDRHARARQLLGRHVGRSRGQTLRGGSPASDGEAARNVALRDALRDASKLAGDGDAWRAFAACVASALPGALRGLVAAATVLRRGDASLDAGERALVDDVAAAGGRVAARQPHVVFAEPLFDADGRTPLGVLRVAPTAEGRARLEDGGGDDDYRDALRVVEAHARVAVALEASLVAAGLAACDAYARVREVALDGGAAELLVAAVCDGTRASSSLSC